MENDEEQKNNNRSDMKLELDSSKRIGRQYLESVLNKPMRLVISDGRLLIGQFLCTDRDKNIILGSCQEFVSVDTEGKEEPRMLGLAMVPGRHVVSMHIDIDESLQQELTVIEEKLTRTEVISNIPVKTDVNDTEHDINNFKVTVLNTDCDKISDR